uniref:Coiled-coil domain containing 84 n=1 Tax=Nothoprocta perdicaria TaxID=30464 RepID=A0A8C6YW72_NOTPE
MQNGRQCIYRTGPSQRHLCRRTSFVGRRHVYSAAHRQSLQLALRRLHDKVEAARAALGGAAVPEHRRATERFWREHRAEAALRPRFLVTAEEYARFSEALARALAAHEEREDERIREMAARIREAERRQQETVRAALEVGAAPRSRCGAARPKWDAGGT